MNTSAATAIFWISALDESHFKNDYSGLVDQIPNTYLQQYHSRYEILPNQSVTSQDQHLKLVKDWLLSENSGNWIIMLDNVVYIDTLLGQHIHMRNV